MRKIRLDVDALAVESFAATAMNAEKAGTVHGRAFTRYWEQSCFQSCTNIADCVCLSELGQCGTTP